LTAEASFDAPADNVSGLLPTVISQEINMRTALVATSLAIVLTIIAAVVHACGGYGQQASLQPGVVAGNQFVCVTTAGHLAIRDLKTEAHRDFTELKPRLLSTLDVSENRACVASDEHVHVIDLKTGKALHMLPRAKGPVSVGFVGKERVFAASLESVEVFNLAAGKLEHRIELRKASSQPKASSDAKSQAKAADKPQGKRSSRGAAPWLAEGIPPCCRHEDLLFVALPGGARDRFLDLTRLGSVAVIDLVQGRVVEEAQVASGITGLGVANGRLLVRSGILSYGIPLEHCTSFPIADGKIDVKSKEVRHIDVSMRGTFDTGCWATAFVDGNDLVVSAGRLILRLDAQGKCLAKADAALGPGRALVGVWNHQPLVTEQGKLQAVTLTPVSETKPAAAE
jgi:hypothetical protein